MDVRFSRFSTGQKYAAILLSIATLTLTPIAFKRQLPNWLEGIMLISGTAIGLSSWKLATDYGNELEVSHELKQFEKVVRVKQLEVEATVRIEEYKNLLMPQPVPYDPNIHQMASNQTTSAEPELSAVQVEFIQFLNGSTATLRETNGYYSVSKLQQKWGKNKKMNATQFKQFLAELTASEVGEFDPSERLWKPLSSYLDN